MKPLGEILDEGPPRADEAERGLISAVLQDPRVIETVHLAPGDFGNERHKIVWTAMKDGAIDIPLLKQKLPTDWTGDFLAGLIDSGGWPMHAAYYAAEIHNAASKRRIREVAIGIVQACANGKAPAGILDWARNELDAEAAGATSAVKIWSAGDLIQQHPRMRPVVVNGIVRAGETMNIIAPSKVGKSWLMYGLGFSIPTGQSWLDTFECVPGRVLLIDNELHRETISHRLTAVSTAMGLGADWQQYLDVISLRGGLLDLYGLGKPIRAIKPGTYSLVIADAFYRFLPAGVSENDNAAMAGLYNQIDAYCEHLQSAAWVNIHHSSKGDQSNKSVTDVGAGAGSQSRAADTHLILRPHQDEGVIVAEAAVRSFPPMEPVCLRWEYPLWRLDGEADPRLLRRPKGPGQQRQEAEDLDGMVSVVAAVKEEGKATARRVRKLTGFGKDRTERLLDRAVLAGELRRTPTTVRGNQCDEYSLVE